MSRRLSISAEQLRAVDCAAQSPPVATRNMLKFHVLGKLERAVGPRAVIIWASAVTLASSPRAHVRLLALNAGRWPRRISEDRLIPDHVLPINELDRLPVADGDKRDFATIIAMAKSATISYSRRDVEGRVLAAPR